MNELIKQLVILLASFLFTFLVGKFPNFPIPQSVWINIFLWILSTFFGINGMRFLRVIINSLTKGEKSATFKL